MASRSTLLFAYGNSNDLILAADGRSTTSEGEHHSDGALKVTLCGKRGALAVGGFCEGVVKTGPRAGWNWRLLDEIQVGISLPSSSAEARAAAVFQSAYSSASAYMPHDSDAGTPGIFSDGIVVIYGEVSRTRDVYLYRADLPVTVKKEPAEGWAWAVDKPIVKPIHPNVSSPGLPFLYLHKPEVHLLSTLSPPDDDRALAASLPTIFATFAKQCSTETVGGEASGIRINNDEARWLIKRGRMP
jgi:hypothetical protein